MKQNAYLKKNRKGKQRFVETEEFPADATKAVITIDCDLDADNEFALEYRFGRGKPRLLGAVVSPTPIDEETGVRQPLQMFPEFTLDHNKKAPGRFQVRMSVKNEAECGLDIEVV